MTDEPESLIEKFVPANGVSYPTAAGGASASFRAWGVSGRPSAYLIDHDGVVIWSGHPGNLSTHILEEAIAKAEAEGPWKPGERHEVLDRAVKAAEDGKIGTAWKNAESARKKAEGDEAATEAIDQFQKEIEAYGGRLFAKAKGMANEGRLFQASEYLEEKMDLFKGAPLEKEWKDELKAWLSTKEGKAQYDLDKKRRKALESAREGEIGDALDDLKDLLEKAEGLPIAARISADRDALRNL